MSSHSIEAVLYDLAYRPGTLQRFQTAPDALFDDYFIAPEERERLRQWDVRAMHEQGVSPMLLMLSYQIVHGIERRNDYLVKMGMKPPAVLSAAPIA